MMILRLFVAMLALIIGAIVLACPMALLAVFCAKALGAYPLLAACAALAVVALGTSAIMCSLIGLDAVTHIMRVADWVER